MGILPTRYSCSPTAHKMDTSTGGPSQQPGPPPAALVLARSGGMPLRAVCSHTYTQKHTRQEPRRTASPGGTRTAEAHSRAWWCAVFVEARHHAASVAQGDSPARARTEVGVVLALRVLTAWRRQVVAALSRRKGSMADRSWQAALCTRTALTSLRGSLQQTPCESQRSACGGMRSITRRLSSRRCFTRASSSTERCCAGCSGLSSTRC